MGLYISIYIYFQVKLTTKQIYFIFKLIKILRYEVLIKSPNWKINKRVAYRTVQCRKMK